MLFTALSSVLPRFTVGNVPMLVFLSHRGGLRLIHRTPDAICHGQAPFYFPDRLLWPWIQYRPRGAGATSNGIAVPASTDGARSGPIADHERPNLTGGIEHRRSAPGAPELGVAWGNIGLANDRSWSKPTPRPRQRSRYRSTGPAGASAR